MNQKITQNLKKLNQKLKEAEQSSLNQKLKRQVTQIIAKLIEGVHANIQDHNYSISIQTLNIIFQLIERSHFSFSNWTQKKQQITLLYLKATIYQRTKNMSQVPPILHQIEELLLEQIGFEDPLFYGIDSQFTDGKSFMSPQSIGRLNLGRLFVVVLFNKTAILSQLKQNGRALNEAEKSLDYCFKLIRSLSHFVETIDKVGPANLKRNHSDLLQFHQYLQFLSRMTNKKFQKQFN